MSPLTEITAIILAGGHSSRFGSPKALADLAGRTLLQHVLDSAAPHFDRILLVTKRPDLFRQVGLPNPPVRIGRPGGRRPGPSLFVGNGWGPAYNLPGRRSQEVTKTVKNASTMPPSYVSFWAGLELVRDAESLPGLPPAAPLEGPLVGLYTGLQASRTDKNFVIACDMPFLTFGVIRALYENSNESAITLPSQGECLQTLCGIYTQECLPFIRKLLVEGERGLRALIQRAPTRLIPVEKWAAEEGCGDPFMDIDTPQDLALAMERLAQNR